MSKRVQTENLKLYAYNTSQGLPTFLKDWSDNADIIDGAIKQNQDDIAENKADIIDLQSQIDVLDPENIRDYKARLDAMENKMATQAALLADNIRHDNDQDALIASNTARIELLENNVTNIQQSISDIREELSTTNANVASLDGRITSLENRCVIVEQEITDLRNDFIGLADDMTDLTHQFDAVVQTVVNKQDKLVAGTGIRIEGNVISATGQGGGVIGQYDSTTENLTLG